MCIHTPSADNSNTVARSATNLQNIEGDRMSGGCKFWLKLNEGRRGCRSEVIDAIGKCSGQSDETESANTVGMALDLTECDASVRVVILGRRAALVAGLPHPPLRLTDCLCLAGD